MVCKKCGVPLKDDAIKCPVCGQPAPGYEGAASDYAGVKDIDSAQSAKDDGHTDSDAYTTRGDDMENRDYFKESNTGKTIPTHLFGSVFVTLLCCVPTGIFALYHAGKVATLLENGYVDEAESHARSAKNWIIISAIAWFVLVCCAGGIFLLSFLNM